MIEKMDEAIQVQLAKQKGESMKVLYIRECGAKRILDSRHSQSVRRGQSTVPVIQTSPRTDPLPGGSTDTRGETSPQPKPATVSTARVAGVSFGDAAGRKTLCGERTNHLIA